MASSDAQRVAEDLLLHRRCAVYLVLHGLIHLLPESRHGRHTRGMGLLHRLLYLVRIGVYYQLGALRKTEVSPSALKHMSERQEVYHPIFLSHGHTLVVGNKSSVILSVAKLHAFALARGATGVKYVAQIVVRCLMPQVLHLRLARQVGSKRHEVVEIERVRIVRTDAHPAVEYDYTLERRAQCEHPVCLVILLLLAHEDESHLRVVYHELYLLLTACGVERNRHGPHAISAEVGIEIFHAVL